MLRKQGYTTAGIGKWHLGWDWNNIDAGKDQVDFSKPVENGPTTRGFDYYYVFCGSLDMAPYVYIENDMPTSLPDRETVNEGKYSWWRKGPTGADFVHEQVLPNLVDRACSYIKEKARNPERTRIPLSCLRRITGVARRQVSRRWKRRGIGRTRFIGDIKPTCSTGDIVFRVSCAGRRERSLMK